MKYQTKIIKKIDQRFIKQWKALWEKAENANIFNSYAWFTMHTEAYQAKNYEIYACFEKGKLVAVLPLIRKRRFGLPVKTTLGDICETPFLMKSYDKDLFKHFFDFLSKDGNFYLWKADEQAITILHELYPRLFSPLMSVNPYLNISTDPLRFLSSSNAADIRKILRKNANDLKFITYEGSTSLEKEVEIMFELGQHSAKQKKAKDAFSKKEEREFFLNLVKYCSQFVHIGFLLYQDKPIAAQFGLRYNKTHLGHYITYLYEYRKLSPGKTMTALFLQELQKSTVERFDLGGGISAYKQEFTPAYHCFYDVYYSRNNVAMTVWKTINVMRRLKQSWFPQKFTRDHEFLFTQFPAKTSNNIA